MTHLTSDQLIDALDGALSAEAGRHLQDCATCKEQFEELGRTLMETRSVEIPDPSPLFWDHFSSRVRASVDPENPSRSGWSQWLRWPVLAPLAGLALLVLALIVTLPRASGPLPTDIAESQNGDILLSDDGWTLVADVLGDLDWETATAAGLTVELGVADRVALELNADEQRELTALLRAELKRTKS